MPKVAGTPIRLTFLPLTLLPSITHPPHSPFLCALSTRLVSVYCYFHAMKRAFFTKPGAAGMLLAMMLWGQSCRERCYDCRLVQINGPNAVPYPNDTIEIDTMITCKRSWVRENETPDDEIYPQSWRCKEID